VLAAAGRTAIALGDVGVAADVARPALAHELLGREKKKRKKKKEKKGRGRRSRSS